MNTPGDADEKTPHSHVVHKHPFWEKQRYMFENAAGAKIFIKNGTYKFSFFSSYDKFINWYIHYKQACELQGKPFEIYELMSTGIDMCFAADLEVYVPIDTFQSKKEKLQFFIMEEFTRIYGKYGQADNLIFMENHRASKHRQERGTRITPMYKISFHVLGKSDLFNEMHTECKMQHLASHVNTELTEAIRGKATWDCVVLPGGNALDMKIY